MAKRKRTKKERQKIDKAVKRIHTDKMQVQDVLKTVRDDLEGEVLKELRRRGGKIYPERGPNTKGTKTRVKLGNNKKKNKK